MECSAKFASQGASAAGPQAVGAGSAAPASGVRWPRACPAGHRGGLLPPLPSCVLAADPTRGYSGEHHMYASKLFLQSPDLQ